MSSCVSIETVACKTNNDMNMPASSFGLYNTAQFNTQDAKPVRKADLDKATHGNEEGMQSLNTNDLLNQLQQLKFEVDSLQSIAKSLQIKLAKSEIRNKLLTSKVEKLKAKLQNSGKLPSLEIKTRVVSVEIMSFKTSKSLQESSDFDDEVPDRLPNLILPSKKEKNYRSHKSVVEHSYTPECTSQLKYFEKSGTFISQSTFKQVTNPKPIITPVNPVPIVARYRKKLHRYQSQILPDIKAKKEPEMQEILESDSLSDDEKPKDTQV